MSYWMENAYLNMKLNPESWKNIATKSSISTKHSNCLCKKAAEHTGQEWGRYQKSESLALSCVTLEVTKYL